MNRYSLSLLAVVALFAAAIGFAQPGQSQARVAITQSNVQVAVNFSLYCPGNVQTAVQGAINLAVVDAPNASVGSINTSQTNLQVGYNVAIASPGATQAVDQAAGNVAVVIKGSASDITKFKQNTGGQTTVNFASPGSAQSISQAALNAVSVQTGSATLTSALTAVINQAGTQLALSVCAPPQVINQITTMLNAQAANTMRTK